MTHTGASLFSLFAAIFLLLLASHYGLVAQRTPETTAPEQLIFETPRSSCWEATREAYLKLHPRCEFNGCRSEGPFEPHHVRPYHAYPRLECDLENLITLCRGDENHHLWVGHQGNFRESNPRVRDDCRRGQFPAIGWERKQRHDADRLSKSVPPL